MTTTTAEAPATTVADAFDAIWSGEANGFGEEKTRERLADFQQTLEKLNAKKITPAKVIGPGVRKPLTNARLWLAGRIADCERDLATRGRGNSLNASNVRYNLPADHPAQGHRIAFEREPGGPMHLWRFTCTCGEQDAGYSALTARDAQRVEDHLNTINLFD